MFKEQARKEFININNNLNNIKDNIVSIRLSLKVLEELMYNHDYNGINKELDRVNKLVNDLKDYNLMKFKQQF